jgi:hypothetical protein
VVSRVNFLDTAPDRIDDVARVVREIVHPGIRDEAGTSATSSSETRRREGHSGSRCGGAAKRGRRATRKRVRSVLASSRRPAGRCARSKASTSCSLTFEGSKR